MVEPNFDTEPEPEARTEEEIQKSFTSKKMDIINCMMIDPRISPSQFKVAVCLIQHASANSGAIFPSQERLSVLLNMSLSVVKRNITDLVKSGWLSKRRQNRQHSNSYAFSTKHLDAMLDRRESLEETMREQRRLANSDRSKTTPQEFLTGQKRHFPRGQKRHFPTGHLCPPNTLREHRKGTPEEVRGMEQGNSNSDTREAETQRAVNSDDR
jgi:DNA-binding MarR family transcriptional regulator